MSESETAALCSDCQKGTTGKIYKPYLCVDCKIKQLEEDVEFYKDQYRSSDKQRDEWVKKFNEESILKTKYRCAFEALYEKISGK